MKIEISDKLFEYLRHIADVSGPIIDLTDFHELWRQEFPDDSVYCQIFDCQKGDHHSGPHELP